MEKKGFHMIGGEDENSYAKNSSIQRKALTEVKSMLESCIEELIENATIIPSCLRVGDLGCSSGPNAFLTAKHIIESIDKRVENLEEENELPSIQYFLNDLVSSDFNLVFKGLPGFYQKLEKENGRKYGSCLIAAMPGSFYGKLFPDRSMNFMHSSYSLHWLSQVPSGLVSESGISTCKESFYCLIKSPPMVRRLYEDQFTNDFSMFLRTRSQELMEHGQLLLTLLLDSGEQAGYSFFPDPMVEALHDLVLEGRIEEEKVDCFHLPIYHASIDGIKQIIEKEGSFKILNYNAFKTPLDPGYVGDDPIGRYRYIVTYLRAVFQPAFASHFGEEIMDDLFHRYTDKVVNDVHQGEAYFSNLVISLKNQK